jgi:hypothetical protein
MRTSRFSQSSEEGDEVFDDPDMVGESGLQCRRHAERLMYPAEVVNHMKYTATMAASFKFRAFCRFHDRRHGSEPDINAEGFVA